MKKILYELVYKKYGMCLFEVLRSGTELVLGIRERLSESDKVWEKNRGERPCRLL
jgi:hypothetical protein